jgi:predicted DCC family thiol-disulfide oxidoreductase YuxK
MRKRQLINIIYDGECSFCIRALDVSRKLDGRGALRFYDSHSAETLKLFPQLLGRDVRDAMYVVVEGEEPQRGFYAFRRIVWSNPSMWPLLPLFYLPGASFFGTRIYDWVARNRYRFGCRSEFCALPSELKMRQPDA